MLTYTPRMTPRLKELALEAGADPLSIDAGCNRRCQPILEFNVGVGGYIEIPVIKVKLTLIFEKPLALYVFKKPNISLSLSPERIEYFYLEAVIERLKKAQTINKTLEALLKENALYFENLLNNGSQYERVAGYINHAHNLGPAYDSTLARLLEVAITGHGAIYYNHSLEPFLDKRIVTLLDNGSLTLTQPIFETAQEIMVMMS